MNGTDDMSDSNEIPADVTSIDGLAVYKIDRRPPEALVIHCGDPRFQDAFRRFVTEELGIRTYTPLIVGGGVHAFGAQTLLPKNFKTLWQQVKFFVKEQDLHDIIIINHEDCQWYRKLQGYFPQTGLSEKGRSDLLVAAGTLLKDFTGVRVRSYWAGLSGDDIVFSEVS